MQSPLSLTSAHPPVQTCILFHHVHQAAHSRVSRDHNTNCAARGSAGINIIMINTIYALVEHRHRQRVMERYQPSTCIQASEFAPKFAVVRFNTSQQFPDAQSYLQRFWYHSSTIKCHAYLCGKYSEVQNHDDDACFGNDVLWLESLYYLKRDVSSETQAGIDTRVRLSYPPKGSLG
jgi:hypothetical protein